MKKYHIKYDIVNERIIIPHFDINNNTVEFRTIVRSPATMQLFFQNHNCSDSENNLSKSSTKENIPFENLVDLFLEKVISRDYDSSKTSCWLY